MYSVLLNNSIFNFDVKEKKSNTMKNEVLEAKQIVQLFTALNFRSLL